MPAGMVGAAARSLLADPASQLARAAGGDGYTLVEHLLMLVLDELRVANWQRSKHGQKGTNRPQQVSPLARKPGTRYGRTDRSPQEVAAYLASIGPRT